MGLLNLTEIKDFAKSVVYLTKSYDIYNKILGP